ERTLQVLFKRDPDRDRQEGRIPFEGYEVLWPDGRPLSVGFDAFCKQGQRLLGLGWHLAGRRERLVEVSCFPLAGRDGHPTRARGHRVRRFCLCRTGSKGRLHFLDGTPTALVLDLERDEPRVLHWIGLPALRDGDCGWMDVAARLAEP